MEDIKKYHALWNDTWAAFQYYTEHMPFTNEEWTDMIDNLNKIVKRNPDVPEFATKFAILLSDELEKIAKFK